MNFKDKRRHLRVRHGANIRLTNQDGVSVDLKTLDFSDGGLFIKCSSEPIVQVGDLASVKVLDIEDALTQQIKIIRIRPGVGIAVEFLKQPK